MENVTDLENLLLQENEAQQEQKQAQQEFLPKDEKNEQGIKNAKALLCGMYSVIFKALAVKRGPLWELDEEEAIELGESTCDVILKYYPDFYLSPELRLAAALAGSVGFRVAMDINQSAEKEKETGTEGEKNHGDK